MTPQIQTRIVRSNCAALVLVLISLLVLCFFFSSRRRHTRLQGDWSSDVCSSDLSSCPNSPLFPAICRTSTAHNRSEEHTSELQSPCNLVCRLLLEKKGETRLLRHRLFLWSACNALLTRDASR